MQYVYTFMVGGEPFISALSAMFLWVYLNNLPFFFVFLPFLGLLLQHMEIPRLGVESELLLPAYTAATATWDPSHVCSLHHCLWQCRILNPLSKARD